MLIYHRRDVYLTGHTAVSIALRKCDSYVLSYQWIAILLYIYDVLDRVTLRTAGDGQAGTIVLTERICYRHTC